MWKGGFARAAASEDAECWSSTTAVAVWVSARWSPTPAAAPPCTWISQADQPNSLMPHSPPETCTTFAWLNPFCKHKTKKRNIISEAGFKATIWVGRFSALREGRRTAYCVVHEACITRVAFATMSKIPNTYD